MYAWKALPSMLHAYMWLMNWPDFPLHKKFLLVESEMDGAFMQC